MARFAISILLGLLVGAALSLALHPFVVMPPDAPWATWHMGINFFGHALSAVAPGFIAGWCAARRGILVGALVALLYAIGWLLYQWFLQGPFSAATAAYVFVTSCAGVITQSVAGAAGEFLRSKWAPLTTHSSGRAARAAKFER